MSEKKEFQIGDIVLYRNNQLIAFNKPAALAVQSDQSGDKSLLDLGEIYCKSKLYAIHRIDRPASGVVLMAKTDAAIQSLSQQFKDRSVEKTYLAVVKQKPEKEQGELIHFLSKNSRLNRSHASEEEIPNSKKSILKYRLLGSSDTYYLLEIQLQTGRHHQIRAQLSAIGCPVKGDVKYGFKRGNRDRSIHLHAWKLSFTHPISKKKEEITAPLPDGPVWDAMKTYV